jgi:hypothetical protein
MPKEENWSLDTPCIVHDVDDVQDESIDLPRIVIQSGFDYVIGIQAVQGIVANLKSRSALPTDEELLQAFIFYLANDAYLPDH